MQNPIMPIIYESDDNHIAYESPSAAGLDLRASISTTLNPGERKLVPTGVKAAIPEGYVGMVCPRSGLAAKNGITIVNAPGIVDSDYRGEIGVVLLNTDVNAPFHITAGDRIAQMVITPVVQVQLKEVDELDETERGADGFGHSGVR